MFVEKVEVLLGLFLVGFEKEGKLYVSIVIGCIGGWYCLVVIVDEFGWWLGECFLLLVCYCDICCGGVG